MTRVLLYIALVLSAFASSCSRTDECDPNLYCNTVKPDSSYLNIQVTYAVGNAVPIEVYDGYIDDGTLYFRDTLYESEVSYYVPVDRRYSVRAFYKNGAQTIVASDGDKLEVKKFWNCNERCYEERELTLDLVLLQ